MLKVLDGFHHWSARWITGMTVTRGASWDWKYLPVVAALEAAGLHPIMEYIRKREVTMVENLA